MTDLGTTSANDQPVNLDAAFGSFDERWAPRVVTTVNDYDVRIAHVEGSHTWHAHDDTDEFFLCLEGEFTIHLRDRDVVLGPGDAFTVPVGVEHFPEAAPNTRILMLEPQGTSTTGDRHDDIAHLPTSTAVTLADD